MREPQSAVPEQRASRWANISAQERRWPDALRHDQKPPERGGVPTEVSSRQATEPHGKPPTMVSEIARLKPLGTTTARNGCLRERSSSPRPRLHPLRADDPRGEQCLNKSQRKTTVGETNGEESSRATEATCSSLKGHVTVICAPNLPDPARSTARYVGSSATTSPLAEGSCAYSRCHLVDSCDQCICAR